MLEDPELRNEVLLSASPEMLSQLPGWLAAEAYELRDREQAAQQRAMLERERQRAERAARQAAA